MSKGRMEAFSDGVLAIIITIMVLELTIPHEADLAALLPLVPVFLSYALSFVFIGIYWNNHHHMLHTVKRVSGSVLWANLHLLFWLSLFPFATGWLGESHFAALPSALYGMVLLMAACAYFILQHAIISAEGEKSLLKAAVGRDRKGKASLVLYVIAVIVAFWLTWVAQLIYIAVAIMWLIPDRRIENALQESET